MRTEEFQALIADTLNKGMTSIMITIGHRTNLFEVMAKQGKATSEEIATAANLKERYVREWLGAMVTARIIEYDANEYSYLLPPEHAFLLTNGGLNFCPLFGFVGESGRVEDKLVESFVKGGGVDYKYFTKFQSIMDEASSTRYKGDTLAKAVLPELSKDLLQKLERGISVVDVGCGYGIPTIVLAQSFPNSSFLGIDFLEESVSKATQKAKELGLSNIQFKQAEDVKELNAKPNQFDMVTAFDAVHDQANPRGLLDAICKSLRPGGYFFMVEINVSSTLANNIEHPLGPALYGISCAHCMTVSLAQHGEGLGACWGIEKAKSYVQNAGMEFVSDMPYPVDPTNKCLLFKKVPLESNA